MVISKVKVNGVCAETLYCKPIPKGIIGAQVEFEYADPMWDNLTKTVVFRGSSSIDILNTQNIVTIPAEVVSTEGCWLSVGVYGVDPDGVIAIPTVWAELGIIHDAADPSGDTSAKSTLPVWAQIQNMIGNMSNLNTTSKENLVDAINEILDNGGGEIDPAAIAAAVADYIRNNPIAETDPTVPAWAKQPTKPSYTAAEVGALPDTYTPPNQTAQQVGADPAGTATTAVFQHNVDTAAHNDLRLALQELANRVNAALDSDDITLDQMSEVVAYIKSNKTLIDAITTSKVSVADIVNDLVTNAADKPLSAAQGVVIKTLIDALRNDKLDAAELTNAVNTALAQAKESGEFDGKPGDPGYTPVKGTDYFTEADKQEIAEQAAGLVSIPDKLPNPNALTFTGAVTGSYDGSAPMSVEIPSGGSEKELTLLADINFDGNTTSVFEYTGLDDVSEIYIVGGEIKSGLDNAVSSFTLTINDITISASSVMTIQKTSGTDTWNNYYIAKFNGAFWESLRSPDHAGASQTGHGNYAKYPNSVVLDVGKAKKLTLYVPNPIYKPVTGWMKIWVR